ncbi:MAG: acetyl-CoA acetyltransferase [Sandaracinaceae bacterium]
MTVFMLGGFQTDFARNYSREGHEVSAILRDAVEGALVSTKLEPKDLDTAHIGNFVAELFSRQGQLGGLLASLHPDLAGLPTARHEAACASGSIAALAASAEIEAGRYDTALVVGVEQMRNVDGVTAADYLGCAAWTGHEAEDAKYVWPALFSRVADEYAERYGIDRAHLSALARIDFDNARRNPVAQTRAWALTDESYAENDEHNAVVEGRLRRQDCGRITDGAAAVVLASERAATVWAKRNGIPLASVPRILGWGHRTAPMALEDKLRSSRETGGLMFPHLRTTLEDAWRRAGLSGANDVDLMEVHDCFSITGYAIVDHLGIAPPGEPFLPIEEGMFEAGGALPLNPSGGLLGLGHPVGATGVRMLHDAARQVWGDAGAIQVEGAKRAQTLNLGGSATTTVSFVVGT